MSTGISWTDETWNPTTGCSKVSEGCRNCYAAKLAPRLAAMGQDGYTSLPWTKQNAPENVKLHSGRLDKPLRWKKPRRVFVNSMSDLFHELVPFEFVDKVFAVMALSPQHTFQVLTKRPERMAEYVGRGPRWWDLLWSMLDPDRGGWADDIFGSGKVRHRVWLEEHAPPWPLPNVWLGTSVEDQRAADERIPHLLRTPAAVRFLSCEPLIGPVNLRHVEAKNGALIDALEGDVVAPDGEIYAAAPGSVHWVIAGGESGPNHRPMRDEWARSLRDQCSKAGVSFFFKQHSGHRNEMDPYLDGREWREMPGVAS